MKLSEAINRGRHLVAGEVHGHTGQCPFERRGHEKLHATVIGMALLGSEKITNEQVRCWPDFQVSTVCLDELRKAERRGEWPEEVVRDVIGKSSAGMTPEDLVVWLRERNE